MTYFSLNKCVCFCLMSIHACMSVYSKEMDSRHKGDLMELNCKLKLKRNEKKKKKIKVHEHKKINRIIPSTNFKFCFPSFWSSLRFILRWSEILSSIFMKDNILVA